MLKMTNIHFASTISVLVLLSLTVTATVTDIFVLDTNNQPLKPNTPYYILHIIPGQGGGLTTLGHDDTPSHCPLYASQEPLETSLGKPLKLYPLPTQNNITLSSDINLIFTEFSVGCAHSKGWIHTLDMPTGRQIVGLGDVSGAPGRKTVNNWFRIEKGGNEQNGGYKIVFCPSVCRVCKVVCGDVSVFNGEGGKILLGFIGHPLLVMFKKA